VRAPWSGQFSVKAGLDARRPWADKPCYGFISAGGGDFNARRLRQLGVGKEVFVCDKEMATSAPGGQRSAACGAIHSADRVGV